MLGKYEAIQESNENTFGKWKLVKLKMNFKKLLWKNFFWKFDTTAGCKCEIFTSNKIKNPINNLKLFFFQKSNGRLLRYSIERLFT